MAPLDRRDLVLPTHDVSDLPPKNRTEHRVRESVQVREKGERDEQAEAVRS